MANIWPLSGASDVWDNGLAGALLSADVFDTAPAVEDPLGVAAATIAITASAEMFVFVSAAAVADLSITGSAEATVAISAQGAATIPVTGEVFSPNYERTRLQASLAGNKVLAASYAPKTRLAASAPAKLRLVAVSSDTTQLTARHTPRIRLMGKLAA